MRIEPTSDERDRMRQVMQQVVAWVREDRRIMLPPFDSSISRPSDEAALQSVGIEPNDFGGNVGDYRYQFEGEEDLLHLIVTRLDGLSLTPEQARGVVELLLPELPPALLWLKPGTYTQHIYFGHDELLRANTQT